MKTAKAIVSALAAGLSAIVAGLSDNHLTTAELATAIVAAIAAYGATWTVPNKKEEDVSSKYPLPPIS